MLVFSRKLQAIDSALYCAKEGLDGLLGKNSSWKGLSSIGTSCPGKW